jgi:GT2 family glycosyltransferase
LIVSVIILAYKRRSSLEVVLGRLTELPVHEVLVVDNGGELEGLTRAGVRVITPEKNIGIAGRNRAAENANGDLLLMLDDDSYPLPGAVEALSEAFESQPRLGVAGGLVRDVDEAGRVLRHDELGTFDWFFRGGRKGLAPSGGWPTFFFPEGASMIRRAAFLQVGGFFEPFFFQSTEVELSTRLLAHGWDVRYLPAARFDHMKEEGSRISKAGLELRVRNQLWYFWMHFPTLLASRRTIFYLAFDFIECTYRGAVGAWTRGVRDAWRGQKLVRQHRQPLPRSVIRRAELNRGRLHILLLLGQLQRKAL